ncbi:GIY-YIG nuclease family protein [Bacillus sp. ISL-47]|uniref:GIY-YIG nuclease family protein n=1 Tax=Bacillus sp. ISL-47 TaxID=2819130 RepID=UPI0033370E7A
MKKLPLSPGVYLMKDSSDQIIYVGKAKNLKNRVQTYFRHSSTHSPKVKKLIHHLKDFEYIQTDTEFEAFMLECQLIKEWHPMYNRMMKSPQSFVYIGIAVNTDYRQIEITYNPAARDGKLYFGPFTSKNTAAKAIQGIKDCFKLNCSNPYHSNTACLNVSLGLCNGLCMGGAAIQQYNEVLDKLIAFLNGQDMRLVEEMEHMMITAAEKCDFETASKYRDSIQAVNALLKKEKMIEFTEKNHLIAIIEKINDSFIKFFLIKRTKVLFSQKYSIENNLEQLSENIKTTILPYLKNHDPTPIDVSRHEIDQAQIIYSYLNSKNCSYVIIQEEWLEPKNHSNIDFALNQLLSDAQLKQPGSETFI